VNPVCIVGAGLAGTYLAIALARRGIAVRLCEQRSLAALQTDMNAADQSAYRHGRSIALALSHRGLHALAKLGLESEALSIARRMLGREIHLEDGSTGFTAYDPTGRQCIFAISRAELFALLMRATSDETLIDIRFGESLNDWQQDDRQVTATFARGSSERFVALIGADGANSRTRESFQANFQRLDFGASYKEVRLYPRDKPFDRQALHIWPRGSLMLTGLPGSEPGALDGTLFLVNDSAASWFTDRSELQRQFLNSFTDVELTNDEADAMMTRPLSRIYTISGGPWYAGKALLIGDAAHAITPFLGQGMNCALEDCAVLLDCIDAADGDLASAFAGFDTRRRTDVEAIARLSLMNCEEMMLHAGTPAYFQRKRLESWLTTHFPGVFVPFYSAIAFNGTPYAKVLMLKELQDGLLDRLQAHGIGGGAFNSAESDYTALEMKLYHEKTTRLLRA
jgi:kynurenine 3-monooxygenase